MVRGQIIVLERREPGQRQGPGAGAPGHFLPAMEQDGVEPGGEPAAFIIALQALPGFHKGFRDKVFRHAEIARQRGGLAEEAGLERLGQTAKRRRVPGTRAPEKFAGGGGLYPVVGDGHLCINPRRAGKGSRIPGLFCAARRAKT